MIKVWNHPYEDAYGCRVMLESWFGKIRYAYPTKIICDSNESPYIKIFTHLRYIKENGKFVGKRLNRRINNYVQRLF